MRYSSQVKPISYLKANAAEVLTKLSEQREPLVITQNGEAAAVLMGVKEYEQLQEGIALLKILSLGEKSMREGKGVPAKEAFANIRTRVREAHAERKANG